MVVFWYFGEPDLRTLPLESVHPQQGYGEDHRQPVIAQQGQSRIPCSKLPMRDAITHGSTQIDYSDFGDGDDKTEVDDAVDSSIVVSSGMQEEQRVIDPRGTFFSPERQEEERQRESATASRLTSSQCPLCNHSHRDVTLVATGEGADKEHGDEAKVEECGSNGSSKRVAQNRCPHHPRERLVRFDSAGQAWCDRLDCWDCYVCRFDGG